MTQGIYKFPHNDLNFTSVNEGLPPENIEAEEAVLGGLLLDPEAIYRVKDRLKPEHFYVNGHKDIYQACLRLHKKNQPINLLTVTSWLSDNNLLKKIGGRNKLASLVDRIVSSVNIDALANLVIEKSIRRDLLRLGNDFIHLGYNTELELSEILDLVSKKTSLIVEAPSVQSKEENERWIYNRLMDELKVIYTTIPDPGFRQWKLQVLAEEYCKSIRFLDNIYAKSLATQCSKLMDYEDLKAAASASFREWLMNGLVPKKTTIVLYADGGVGKTKFVYGLAKSLIKGTAWGDFLPTGEKRKVLIYQGDETEADMLQALEAMGYSEGDINKYVRVRFGWSFENMPLLIQDLNDFQPDFVVIDSLTHANRLSIYRESDMEYCRPLLEITGLANQHNCTFLVIHHANKGGDIRGSTAIRNSVSEVWSISKDNSGTATPDDRFLEINKSRSRSSGVKYRMIFNRDDLSFTFLGEETAAPVDKVEQSAKKQLHLFLDQHRNVKYTSEELSHYVNISPAYCRRVLGKMASDGLINRDQAPGKSNLYYLAHEGSPQDHPSIHPFQKPESVANEDIQLDNDECINYGGSPKDHPQDHLQDVDTEGDTAEGDPLSTNIFSEKSGFSKKDDEIEGSPDHLCSEPLPDIDCGGDPMGDPMGDPGVIRGEVDHPSCESPTTFNCGDRVRLLTDCTKHSAGTEMLVYFAGNKSLKLVPPGIDPKQDRDQFAYRDKNQVELIVDTPTETEQPTKPTIEEGKVYWSKSLNSQVKVIKVFRSVKKADVYKAREFEKIRLEFSDLFLSPPSYAPGERVEVLADGHHKGKTYVVSSINGGECWLKQEEGKRGSRLNKPVGPFTPEQLRRV